MISCDILIAGAGPAGTISAIALARRGYDVILVDPEASLRADPRSTAFLAPSVDLLREIGLWDEALETLAQPLACLRLIEAPSTSTTPRTSRDFEASDHGWEAFGWNLKNSDLKPALAKAAANTTGLRILRGEQVRETFARTGSITGRLGDGKSVSAKLVIAADGRNSTLREALKIGTFRQASGQKALAFSVSHAPLPGRVSTEIYLDGGPMTFVPLPGKAKGLASESAVVWMDDSASADAIAALPPEAFNAALERRSLGLFGPLTRTGATAVFSVEYLLANRLCDQRLILLGEAAHVLPPIGAQGLNASLADLAVLLDLLAPERSDPGSDQICETYSRLRRRDLIPRLAAIATLNAATRVRHAPLQALRAEGMRLAHDVRGLRNLLVRAGLGGAKGAREIR